MRLSSLHGGLFFGDAKHSEGPNDASASARLAEYLRWLWCPARPGLCVLAVCHRAGEGKGWRETLNGMANTSRRLPPAKSRRLMRDAEVTWLRWTLR